MSTKDQNINNDFVIEIKHLQKSFDNKTVLKDLSLNVRKSENIVILGKSGIGKSVLIKCIVGLINPDGGSLKVFGKEVSEMNTSELNTLRTKVGFIFQGNALYDSMTVRENLEFPLRRHRSKFDKEIHTETLVQEALENVGLLSAIDLMPAELSGGMKRRIALARTLILQPKIILYDEPTSGLDPITAKEIILLMQDIQKKYKTSSLIITHDVDCARVISDRMILLIDGVDYAEGTYDELSSSTDKNIKAFFKH